jgi:hypothetical protein
MRRHHRIDAGAGGIEVRIRRHLSYANVMATLALLLSLAGGAYAVEKISSRDVVNNSLRSADLRNGRAVKAHDVKSNDLTRKQIDERTLDAAAFAPIAGDESVDCDPSSASLVDCVKTTLPLKERSRILVIATGNEESVSAPAQASCRLRIDSSVETLAVSPGEGAFDNTSSTATNGFARTLVTDDPLPRGRHTVALVCNQLAGDVRIDAPTIAAIAIASR